MYQNQLTQYTHENECPYCPNYHNQQNTCVAICPQCSSIHRRDKVQKGFCPHNTQFAKDNQIQKIQSICNQCIQTNELLKSMAFRLCGQSSNNLNRIKIQMGRTCSNPCHKHQSEKLVRHCIDGCSQCAYLKYYINPQYKKEYLMPQKSKKSSNCCFCLDSINVGDEISRLQCFHQFHYTCLGLHVVSDSRTCPTCRNEDFNIQITEEYKNALMENCNKDKDASLLERLKVLQTKRFLIGVILIMILCVYSQVIIVFWKFIISSKSNRISHQMGKKFISARVNQVSTKVYLQDLHKIYKIVKNKYRVMPFYCSNGVSNQIVDKKSQKIANQATEDENSATSPINRVQ